MKSEKIALRVPGNYVLMEELSKDSIGTNFRAVELEEGKNTPLQHRLIGHVYPFLFTTPEEWNRTNTLCQKINQVGTPNLYTPEKLVRTENDMFLIFPFLEGKTLAQLVEDASRKKKYVPFGLAFSIAAAIASLIEVCSSLAVKGQNVFHGFLTPDHILLDYEGNIYVKYFGIWSLLDENQDAMSEMIRMYGAWLPPEFIRREKIVNRSDFYHLGYLVYRMLTGNYFSYLPGEDFESTFTSISFVSDLPSTDIGFLTNLINFFKKTLNPDINKRFVNIKDFRNYVFKYFKPEEFSAFKASLTAYMGELYADTIEEEDRKFQAELNTPVPLVGPENDLSSDNLMEHIPIGTEEKKRSRFLTWGIIAAIIIIGVIGGYFIIDEFSKAHQKEKEAALLLENQSKEKIEFERKLQEVQQKLKTLEVQKPGDEKNKTTETTNVADEKTQAQINDDMAKAKSKENLKNKTDVKDKNQDKSKIMGTGDSTVTRQDSTASYGKDMDNKNKTVDTMKTPTGSSTVTQKPVDTTDKKDNIQSKDKEEAKAPIISLNDATSKPQRVSGKDPEYPESIRQTYVGRRATVRADLLIDENGNVAQVEILNKNEIPSDIQSIILNSLKQWKFKPAQKGDMKAKIWWPVTLKINFKPE